MAPEALDGIEDLRTVVQAAADASPGAAAAAERVQARLEAYLVGKLSADQALGLTDAARHRWRCDRARRHFLAAWHNTEMDIAKETDPASNPKAAQIARRLYSRLQRQARSRAAARTDFERELLGLLAVQDRPYSNWRSVLQRYRRLAPAENQDLSPSHDDPA